MLARQLPDARIIKTFNTMNHGTLAKGGDASDNARLVLFVAGDDAEAEAGVPALIEGIGFSPVDAGSLRDGRNQRPGSPIYNAQLNRAQALEELSRLG